MRKQTKQWTIKDGSKIRICDMSDSHLLNTIRMLIRGGEFAYCYYLKALYHEEERMGDGTVALQLIQDQVLWTEEEQSWRDFVPEIFENFDDEADRRGINFDHEEYLRDWLKNLERDREIGMLIRYKKGFDPTKGEKE